MLGPIKIAQLVSIIFMISGIVLFLYNIIKSKPGNKRLYAEDPIKEQEERERVYFEEDGEDYV